MDKYIEMLEKIKDNVHVERLASDSLEWLGKALIVVAMVVLFAFTFLLILSLMPIRTGSISKLEHVGAVITFMGILTTLVLFVWYTVTSHQSEHLTSNSESDVVAYVSQLSNMEYNDLKQQVELHRDSRIEDGDLKAINNLLIKKMLPRRNSIIFFRTGAIVNE